MVFRYFTFRAYWEHTVGKVEIFDRARVKLEDLYTNPLDKFNISFNVSFNYKVGLNFQWHNERYKRYNQIARI